MHLHFVAQMKKKKLNHFQGFFYIFWSTIRVATTKSLCSHNWMKMNEIDENCSNWMKIVNG